MTFDGVPRPSQLNPYTDALGPYSGAYAARDLAKVPKVKAVDKKVAIDPLKEKLNQEYDDDDEEGAQEFLSDEEKEQIQIFAKLRGLMNFALQEGVQYRFEIENETGCVNLVIVETGQIVLTLTPEELMHVCEKAQRYSGRIMDEAG